MLSVIRFPRLVSIFVAASLYLLSTGCGSVGPRQVRVALSNDLNNSDERDAIEVHVVAVSASTYVEEYRDKDLNEYWKENDKLAARAVLYGKVFHFGKPHDRTTDQLIRGSDREDEFWRNQDSRYCYLIVIANGPYDQVMTNAKRPLSQDKWAKVLPLQSAYWDGGEEIWLKLDAHDGLVVMREPKNWQAP